jgi:hypothetical protein
VDTGHERNASQAYERMARPGFYQPGHALILMCRYVPHVRDADEKTMADDGNLLFHGETKMAAFTWVAFLGRQFARF